MVVCAVGLMSAGACGPGFTPLEVHPVVLRNYEAGAERSATVGEPIFRVQQASEVPVFVVGTDYRVPGTRVPIPAGTRFVGRSRNPAGDILAETAEPYRMYVISADGARYGLPTGAGARVGWFKDPSPFRRLTDIGDQPGAFTAELIYSGLAGSVVRAVYREYVDDLARPAFSQELQYDLSADRTIAYKSIRIRVIEATNSLIRYEVVSDDGLPWLPNARPAATLLP
jgi:hypothetical protein